MAEWREVTLSFKPMNEDHKTIEVTGAGGEKENCPLCYTIVDYEIAIACKRRKCPVLVLPF